MLSAVLRNRMATLDVALSSAPGSAPETEMAATGRWERVKMVAATALMPAFSSPEARAMPLCARTLSSSGCSSTKRRSPPCSAARSARTRSAGSGAR